MAAVTGWGLYGADWIGEERVGYYTHYEIHIVDIGNEDMDRLLAEECYDLTVADFVRDNGETYKWYQHENEVKVISKKFPTALIQLKGEGEEAGDLWLKYFKDGKMQVCRAIVQYEPFDPHKLR